FRPFLDELRGKLAGARTLLVLFGDHGEEYDDDSYGHQNTLAEGALRVPLIFQGPGILPGLHTNRVRSVDLAPTLLELMDDPARGRMRLDGVSLVPTLTAGSPYPERTAFAQVHTAETREYLAFMKRTLLSGRKSGSLPHVLHKEVGYDGRFKLTRQTFEQVESGAGWERRACPPRLKLERIDGEL